MNAPATVNMRNEDDNMLEEDSSLRQSDEIFSRYENHEILPGCQPHPGDIVEASSLSALSLPKKEYPLEDSIPHKLIAEGKLSSLQLEGVLHACQRHQVMLDGGSRAGFFLGDAAGVGKGRQIGAVVLDNFARGRLRHIWFSISADLVVDARRDLSDLDCHIKVIDGCQQLDRQTRAFGLPADFRAGIVFSTYSTLVSSFSSGNILNPSKRSRIDQLIDWCGGEKFDGCLIFDECHKAKNFVPGKEASSTKVAIAVTRIQRLLPKARVMYCSATGVTNVKNMAFMERLGIWGVNAPFRTFEDFLSIVQTKGLGVAEMLAMEMKMSGMYVSRGLSFAQTEFLTEEIYLSEDQIEMYDKAAHVWNELRRCLHLAFQRTGQAPGRVWTQFWATHQRFFKQLCLGIKVPEIVRTSKRSLEEGFCVVIGIQTTGESSLENELNRDGGTAEFSSVCREMLARFIQLHFPTDVTLAATESQPARQVPDEWCVASKQSLLRHVVKMKLPVSPLDDLIDRLGGVKSVAEMTGRRSRMVRVGEKAIRLQARSQPEFLNVAERAAFMAGRKLVAIISDAASTGISLHADCRAGNTRRRIHLTAELAWSADKVVQQLGRSHRSNQVSAPIYKLLTTQLGGEKRFAAAVAKRLQSLGALTKGDRRAASVADLSEFDLDTNYGRAALRQMFQGIAKKEALHRCSADSVAESKHDEVIKSLLHVELIETPALADRATPDVARFLNRILGLSIERQQMLFGLFSTALQRQVENAKKEGRYNDGLVDVTGTSITREGPCKVVETRSLATTTSLCLRVDRGISWDLAVKRRQAADDSKLLGFYRSRRPVFGRHLPLLVIPKPGSSHLLTITRPNTGLSHVDLEKDELLSKYEKMSEGGVCELWKEMYESCISGCMHGDRCKQKSSCSIGARVYTLHILSGGVVAIFGTLERCMAMFAGDLNLSKAEQSLRVVRVALNDGSRVVGVRFPYQLLPLLESILAEKGFHDQVSMVPATGGMVPAAGEVAPATGGVVPLDQPAGKSGKEPPSAVIAKFLKKAMTPPLTMHSFFKKVDLRKPISDENSSQDGAGEPSAASEANYLQFLDDHQTAGGSSEVNYLQFLDDCQTDEAAGAPESVEPGRATSAPPGKWVLPSQVLQPTKRKLAEANTKQSAKRSQPDLRKVIGVAKKKTMECPICQHEFSSGTKMAAINEHIDNCLIE